MWHDCSWNFFNLTWRACLNRSNPWIQDTFSSVLEVHDRLDVPFNSDFSQSLFYATKLWTSTSFRRIRDSWSSPYLLRASHLFKFSLLDLITSPASAIRSFRVRDAYYYICCFACTEARRTTSRWRNAKLLRDLPLPYKRLSGISLCSLLTRERRCKRVQERMYSWGVGGQTMLNLCKIAMDDPISQITPLHHLRRETQNSNTLHARVRLYGME